MSEYPATLGDLADVEARLEAMIQKVQRQQEGDCGVNDEKFDDLHQKLASLQGWSEVAAAEVVRLNERVNELEKLWIVARENPDLVRELAAQALKGREPA